MFLASVLDLIGGGSRSTTPVSLISRKSPTMDQGVQAGAGGTKDKKNVERTIQPPGQRSGQQRERKDSRGEQIQQRNQRHQQGQNAQVQNQQQGNRGSWTNRGNMRQRGKYITKNKLYCNV